MTSATAKPPRPLRLNKRERADEQQQHHTAGRRCQTGGEIFCRPPISCLWCGIRGAGNSTAPVTKSNISTHQIEVMPVIIDLPWR
jgi:hypothetical protein